MGFKESVSVREGGCVKAQRGGVGTWKRASVWGCGVRQGWWVFQWDATFTWTQARQTETRTEEVSTLSPDSTSPCEGGFTHLMLTIVELIDYATWECCFTKNEVGGRAYSLFIATRGLSIRSSTQAGVLWAINI